MPDAKPDETKPDTPPWGSPEEFDPERAWQLIVNLREERDGLKTERDDARTEAADFKAAAEQTGTARDEALSAALKRAEDAERTLAIRKHDLPDDVVEEFADYLTGTPAEVEAKAAKLAARLAPPKPETPEPKTDEPKVEEPKVEEPPALPGRPTPKLTPGGETGPDDTGFDAKAIAQAARARL